MIKEAARSILPAEEIKKYIKGKYVPTVYKVYVIREEVEIYIEVQNIKKGFEVITPYRFLEKDIREIAEKILKKKNISIKSSNTKIKGGKFIGILFTWAD